MSIPLLKPALYAADDADPQRLPRLLGGRCHCGYVFFPMQTFGCERCGKDGAALKPVSLRGSGTLLTAAVVHMHADKRRPTPFAIGTIALDDGPVIRTLLADIQLVDAPRARVEAELVPVTREDGAQALDLRFRRAAA